MKRPVAIILFASLLLLSAGCFNRKIYKPPAMGAESSFNSEMKPEKRTKHLFNKDMRKYLDEKGVPGSH